MLDKLKIAYRIERCPCPRNCTVKFVPNAEYLGIIPFLQVAFDSGTKCVLNPMFGALQFTENHNGMRDYPDEILWSMALLIVSGFEEAYDLISDIGSIGTQSEGEYGFVYNKEFLCLN